MPLAHLGIAAFIFGATVVKGFESEQDVRMEPGDTISIGGYVVRFKGIGEAPGPNYRAYVGAFDLERDAKVLGTLRPEKRVYRSSGQPMTEAAIDRGFTRDVYISLGEPIGENAWAVRVYYKPFVNWIWLGCVIMALGGVLAVADRRYRRRGAQSSSDTAPARIGSVPAGD